ncbi:MAG: alpha/beta hydrolase fold domain-containing protein [Desulfatibacillaceae bacterium]
MLFNPGPFSVWWQRTTLETVAGRLGKTPKKAGVIAGEINGVPVEEITGWEQGSGRTLLYLHGGAYFMGSPLSHRAFASGVSRVAMARGVVAGYRLAPEHPFPAALDDALAVYRGLLERGADPVKTAIAGDSAGGGLTLALLLALRDAGDPLPACAWVISPYTDLAVCDKSYRYRFEGRRRLSDYYLRYISRMYAGGQDKKHPHISPCYGDYSGLCPILIQAAEAELLREDARNVARAAESGGVPAKLTMYPGSTHVLPAMSPRSEEARALFAEARQFFAEHLGKGEGKGGTPA